MRLPWFIACRYLFAKKSHNVINIISAISGVGMAVGTAALIIILSVYNGFDALVKSLASRVEPDLLIVPSKGKFFVPEGPAYDWAYDCPDIKNMCTVLQDNVFVNYDGNQSTAFLKGIDDIYEQESALSTCVVAGEFRLRKEEVPYAAVGVGFCGSMGINHHFITALQLYYPDSSVRFSKADPMSSLRNIKVWPSCQISVGSEMDTKLVVVGIETARKLFGKENGEVSAVEIRLADGCKKSQIQKIRQEIQLRLGDEFKVLDRMQQNPSLYKMLRYEKLSVYLIMIFVVLILGFSIFGSLTMLIIDKSEDIGTLSAMGASKKTIRSCFTLEGWLITLTGMTAGMASGIIFCLVQQHFGIIRMPGNYVVDSYPVLLQWQDVLLSAASICAMGYLIALIPSARSTSH